MFTSVCLDGTAAVQHVAFENVAPWPANIPHIDPTPSVLAAWRRTSRLHSQRLFWHRVSAGNLWTFSYAKAKPPYMEPWLRHNLIAFVWQKIFWPILGEYVLCGQTISDWLYAFTPYPYSPHFRLIPATVLGWFNAHLSQKRKSHEVGDCLEAMWVLYERFSAKQKRSNYAGARVPYTVAWPCRAGLVKTCNADFYSVRDQFHESFQNLQVDNFSWTLHFHFSRVQ